MGPEDAEKVEGEVAEAPAEETTEGEAEATEGDAEGA